jgi:signal transduction histidine kinase
MRLGLVGRILIAAAVVVCLLVADLAVLVDSIGSVRSATRSEHRDEQATVAAVRVEKLVVDLETGARGYVLSRDPHFLEPWRSAQRELPVRVHELLASRPGGTAKQIADGATAYEQEWAVPVVRIAETHPEQARGAVASGEGARRVEALRALIDPFVAHVTASAAADRSRIDDAEHRGFVVGLVGVGLTVGLVALVAAYLLHAAVWPLRRIAAATESVAAGARGLEVPEQGPGEVGRLATAFNALSRSLGRQQQTYSEQNADLERLANVLRAVLDSTVDGILLSDPEGNVQLANRPMVQLTRELGMTYRGTVVDRLLSIQARMADPVAYRASMERLRSNPEEPTFDEFEDAVGGRVLQGFTAPVRDDRGLLVGRVWTLRDVTQQRELDKLKDDFVATVSHELRTPLTSMMGFLEMIREGEAGKLGEDQKRYLSIVYRSSERLMRLVTDLLFVSRLEANGIQLTLSDVHVDEVAREAVDSASALAESRDLDLVGLIETVPPIEADRERIAQLLGNLVSNAIKFTPAGGHVAVRCAAADRRIVLEVEDTGFGIPAEEQERLFQRFFRSSIANVQAIPGTGLGLVIAKAIAEAHGGTIGVRSEAGKGTCVSVELPLERAEEPPATT